MWKYLNKGISTPIAIGIILILVIIVGSFTWWQYGEIRKKESNVSEVQIPEKKCEECKEKVISWCRECESLNWPTGIQGSPILSPYGCLIECFDKELPKTN